MSTEGNTSVTVFTEERFLKSPDGFYYSPSHLDDAFWARYLTKFSNVVVAARVQHISQPPKGNLTPLTDSRVTLFEIPNYQGALEYLKSAYAVKSKVSEICVAANHVVLRMPGQLSNLASHMLDRSDKAYSVELVGDPEDVFGNGGAGGLLSNYFASTFFKKTKSACANAAAASYVTTRILQEKYPPNPNSFTTSYSSIVLKEQNIAEQPRTFPANSIANRLVTIGSLEQMTKGVDTLLYAMAELKLQYPEISLKVVGDGQCREKLESLSKKLGCSDVVEFCGWVENSEIYSILDNADVFVLATRGEGLPRVIIEAMARALPAISTNVSGIPELLEPNYMVQPDDPTALSAVLAELIASPTELSRLSSVNLAKSSYFESSKMQSQREEFYEAIINNA